ERASGPDRLASLLGMSLDRALALTRDATGRAELLLRLEGDTKQPLPRLLAAFPPALREAVPEAVTVPLFAGSDVVGRSDAERVRLAPITFGAGSLAIPPAAAEALERLAVVLRWDPELVATVGGLADETDARALLEAPRSAASGDAKSRDGATPVSTTAGAGRGPGAEDGAGERAAAEPVADATELAARRADAVRDRLVAELGIAPERIRTVPPVRGAPGVSIVVGPKEGSS